jgi:hypothetical protein
MRRALTLLFTPLFLVSTVLTGTASADTTKAAYSWHIADQFLQDNVGSPQWAIAEADNGDLIKLRGTGLLDGGDKTASGGGVFELWAPDGTLVAAGTFEVHGLTSLDFYGCGGDGLPDFLCGGDALVSATFTPASAPSLHLPAAISIDCLLGDKIPPAAHEGVKVNVKDLLNFNHTRHSGFTVFLAE